MNSPTEGEVIKYRQATCEHVFARGFTDSTAQCVHCGLKEHDYVPPIKYLS